MGASEAPVPRLLGEGRMMLPSPLGVVRNFSVEFPIMAYHGVDTPLQDEPMKVASVSALLGERLRPPK
jgi:hypothetical protein